MLSKPNSCSGCPLHSEGEGFMEPFYATNPIGNGVALVGEALGENEAKEGRPFVGAAGFRLTRLIEWAGYSRDNFDIFNVVWCRPPGNKLEGTSYEHGAISHCRSRHWERLLERNNVLVPMGNVPLGAFTGRKGILSTRGYVRTVGGQLVVPTVHPSFIQRGQSKWSAPFISDIQKACDLARVGYPPQVYDYVLDPSPLEALVWAREYRSRLTEDPSIRLSYDIETPYKSDDESENTEGEEDDIPSDDVILRIGFSYRPYSALSIPFDGAYRAAIEECLSSPGEKVVWNGSFDTPRLRRAGCKINGLVHDGMVAWHVLHSDLPKGLGFVATFTCPFQEEWKHLNSSRPAFYNATDADVELRSMIDIEKELRRTGLWSVYDRDVVQLEPILEYMSSVGMPIDADVRLEKAVKLAHEQSKVLDQMVAAVPTNARKIKHVYKKPPRKTDGLSSREASVAVKRCNKCGLVNPRGDHFKVFKKKQNPCAGAKGLVSSEPGVEWFSLADFKPSRTQLIEYQRALNRPVPSKYDSKSRQRKLSMDEKAIKSLINKYPDDKLYPLVLTYRELDKVAGTYIGRPIDS